MVTTSARISDPAQNEARCAAGYAPYPLGVRPDKYALVDEYLDGEIGQLHILRSRAVGRDVTVFIHGLNGSWRSWMPMLQALAARGTDVGDVMIVDFSKVRLPRSVAEMTALKDWLLDVIGQRGWGGADLVGHSTGGSLAAFAATSTHSRVSIKSLRLVSGLYVRLFDEARTSILRTDRTNATSRTLAKLKVAASLGPMTEFAMKRLASYPRILRSVGGGLYADPDQLPEDVMASLAVSFDSRALRDTLAIGRIYFPSDIYPEIRVPVRLAIGELDPLIEVADAEIAARLIPQLEWRAIAGAGHFAHVERPDATVAYLWS
jgi:pimeloyl-ACP methyl ester carboxylesterase